MNGIFKLVVIALMGALFAAGHRDSGDAGSFQSAGLDANQMIVRLR